MKKPRRVVSVWLVVLMLQAICCHIVFAELPYAMDWSVQIGSSEYDASGGVVVDDAGYVYFCGWSAGDLFDTATSDTEGFLVKLDSTGSLVWFRQADMRTRTVALDSQGNIYTGGDTTSSLYAAHLGSRNDAVLIKYDPDGNELWGRQFGDTIFHDSVYSIAVDRSDNVYLGGKTKGDDYFLRDDAYAMKYDPSGVELWYEQFGTSIGDTTAKVALDQDSNVYLSGVTRGDLAGINENSEYGDVFLAKHDSTGNRLWARQYGTPKSDSGASLAIDDQGNAYLLGSTSGSLAGPKLGSSDVFLKKIDPSGTELWSRQIGTSSRDVHGGIGIDHLGHVFITGWTAHNIAAQSAGEVDMFLMKFDPLGNEVWAQNLGIENTGGAPTSLALDAQGNVFVGGYTRGSFAGEYQGNYDTFLIKFAVPEPTTIMLLAVSGLIASIRRPGAAH